MLDLTATPARTDLHYVHPDGWNLGGMVYTDHELVDYEDGRWATRIDVNSSGPITDLAVGIKITGKAPRLDRSSGQWRIRCRITFLGDCEPDTHSGGWLYLKSYDEVTTYGH